MSERLFPPSARTESDNKENPADRGHTEKISCYSSVVWKDCEEIGLVMKRK